MGAWWGWGGAPWLQPPAKPNGCPLPVASLPPVPVPVPAWFGRPSQPAPTPKGGAVAPRQESTPTGSPTPASAMVPAGEAPVGGLGGGVVGRSACAAERAAATSASPSPATTGFAVAKSKSAGSPPVGPWLPPWAPSLTWGPLPLRGCPGPGYPGAWRGAGMSPGWAEAAMEVGAPATILTLGHGLMVVRPPAPLSAPAATASWDSVCSGLGPGCGAAGMASGPAWGRPRSGCCGDDPPSFWCQRPSWLCGGDEGSRGNPPSLATQDGSADPPVLLAGGARCGGGARAHRLPAPSAGTPCLGAQVVKSGPGLRKRAQQGEHGG